MLTLAFFLQLTLYLFVLTALCGMLCETLTAKDRTPGMEGFRGLPRRFGPPFRLRGAVRLTRVCACAASTPNDPSMSRPANPYANASCESHRGRAQATW